MLLTDTARSRARALSAIGAVLSVTLAVALWFGMNDHSWSLLVPVVATIAATVQPTRIVVAVAMLATTAIVVLGIDGSGVLFGASVGLLMLALNNLQAAATHVRPRVRGRTVPTG
ncbi:MAG TPA: hypothetical protein VFO55_13710 [Gemmatimonadaceae bacterium]|nr:hypothetical protein [Gemmatimonadaceae bacterium]